MTLWESLLFLSHSHFPGSALGSGRWPLWVGLALLNLPLEFGKSRKALWMPVWEGPSGHPPASPFQSFLGALSEELKVLEELLEQVHAYVLYTRPLGSLKTAPHCICPEVNPISTYQEAELFPLRSCGPSHYKDSLPEP